MQITQKLPTLVGRESSIWYNNTGFQVQRQETSSWQRELYLFTRPFIYNKLVIHNQTVTALRTQETFLNRWMDLRGGFGSKGTGDPACPSCHDQVRALLESANQGGQARKIEKWRSCQPGGRLEASSLTDDRESTSGDWPTTWLHRLHLEGPLSLQQRSDF